MRFTSLGSGSSGNGLVVECGRTRVMMDCGFSIADTKARLERVGLALDRVGFTVEDRDRSKGVFYVRYVDPEVDHSQTQKTSWTEKLMFWKSPPKSQQPQYRIHVADAGANSSQVVVQDKSGATENSSTGKKILGLLYEQLK